jgi:hypothetical protein
MRFRVLAIGTAVGIALCVSGPVAAHHGGAAFDQTKTVTFEGTVTEFRWSNPHVLIYFDVTKDGKTEQWSGWLTAPNLLARRGWTKNTLVPGNHITVSGTPHKAGEHIIQIRRLLDAQGKDVGGTPE